MGSEIPADLQRQWIQGTGPAAKPNAPLESSIRNVAYALLSGADGWKFDGEDALGQIRSMSLDNQRNLKLAIHRDPVFLNAARRVADEMNAWADGFFGHRIIDDWEDQLGFTTKIFRPRGLHLDDHHVRDRNGRSFSASIVDLTLYVVNNFEQLNEQIKRLNAARFQLDVMKVPGIIVARTDAEAATLLDGKGDERDQPFLLGVTNPEVPGWRVAYLSILKRFHESGVGQLRGHLLYRISAAASAAACEWLQRKGIFSAIETLLEEHRRVACRRDSQQGDRQVRRHLAGRSGARYIRPGRGGRHDVSQR